MHRRSNALLLWLGYCAFVVYGSLVPLEFRPLSLDDAWGVFQRAPVLEIGTEHRADWISNIVLFVPVGFLSAHLLMRSWLRLPRAPLLVFAAAFSFALAAGIEFAQIFFPPRTVALNDLFAEAVGSLIGLAIAARYSGWFAAALRAGPIATRRIDSRWLLLYVLGYVAFSLFPFDFVLSASELEHKLASSSFGWIAAGHSQGVLVALLRLASEVMLTLPVGCWLAATQRGPSNRMAAAAFGALLGIAIELAQFFMVSGVTQGLSVATRTAGVVLGAGLWQQRSRLSLAAFAAAMRRHAPLLAAAYLLTLLQANHVFTIRWQPWTAAQQLHELRFLPFYYHYYTTEMAALASLATVAMLYAPIGVGTWALRWSQAAALGLACAAAFAIEFTKLFVARGHPDPTDLLIACFAAWAVHRLLGALEQGAASPTIVEPAAGPMPELSEPRVDAGATARRPGLVARFVWLAAMALACWSVAGFPVLPGLLGALLVGAAVTVWMRPALAFLIIPAALPILDLAPWSGRLLVDEFDLLLLVTLATAQLRMPARPGTAPSRDPLLRGVGAFVALAFTIGILHSLLLWQGGESLPAEALQGPLNALRIGKGALWALLACLLWRRIRGAGDEPRRLLEAGAVTGLALTVAVILWERLTFTDLLDFSTDYRVTGPFSAMHTGGAYIECFLIVATTFLLVRIVESRHWLSRVTGALLLAAATYALMVTFSRAAMAAFVVAVAIVLGARMLARAPRLPRWAWPAGLAALMLLIAVPVARGPFAQARAEATESDFSLRLHHWTEALSLRPGGVVTELFGAGLGRFPELHYWWHDTESRTGIFHLGREARGPFLRLGSGDPVYVEQFVAVAPGHDYTLQLDVRSALPGAEIEVSLCEKWLLTSFDCVRRSVASAALPNEWKTVTVQFNSAMLGGRPWYAARPVKLALHNPKQAQAFDVANLRFQDTAGHARVDNGDFSAGMDHWFFSADKHLPWHAKSMPIDIWFDLGWLGVAALAALFSLACVRAARAALAGDLRAAGALAALAGFGIVGLFDSLIDTPRFLLLLLGLCALAAGTPPVRRIGVSDA
jgi:glycopeptide antibiotics resistance protein